MARPKSTVSRSISGRAEQKRWKTEYFSKRGISRLHHPPLCLSCFLHPAQYLVLCRLLARARNFYSLFHLRFITKPTMTNHARRITMLCMLSNKSYLCAHPLLTSLPTQNALSCPIPKLVPSHAKPPQSQCLPDLLQSTTLTAHWLKKSNLDTPVAGRALRASPTSSSQSHT